MCLPHGALKSPDVKAVQTVLNWRVRKYSPNAVLCRAGYWLQASPVASSPYCRWRATAGWLAAASSLGREITMSGTYNVWQVTDCRHHWWRRPRTVAGVRLRAGSAAASSFGREIRGVKMVRARNEGEGRVATYGSCAAPGDRTKVWL